MLPVPNKPPSETFTTYYLVKALSRFLISKNDQDSYQRH